ncbi:MAG: serine hydrolase domain-containing protein [Anaerovorax sp.]|nr:serine hydrolase domain-containing protein [Anaerovorax sp.]
MKFKMKRSLILLICIFLFTSCTVSPTPEQKLDHHLMKLTKDSNSPSLSVLIADHGKVVYKKSFGYANVEEKIPATPSTNYRLASVTKMFTAMCIILLKEQGRLDYEAPVHTILKDFPEYGKDITVRHLLTHTSGLKDYYGEPTELIGGGFTETNQLTDHDVYEIVKRMDGTYFEPGKDFQYSDTGYTVLGQVVEAISGTSLADFMTENIFKPLDMTQTVAYDPVHDPTIPNRALGAERRKGIYITHDQSYSSGVLGDGGVYSSLEDLYKWDQALDNGTLISKEALNEAYHIPSHNFPSQSYTYRCGWFIFESQNDIIEQSHNGATQGFSTYYLKQPMLGKTLIVLSNKNLNDDAYELHTLVRSLYDFKPTSYI